MNLPGVLEWAIVEESMTRSSNSFQPLNRLPLTIKGQIPKQPLQGRSI